MIKWIYIKFIVWEGWSSSLGKSSHSWGHWPILSHSENCLVFKIWGQPGSTRLPLPDCTSGKSPTSSWILLFRIHSGCQTGCVVSKVLSNKRTTNLTYLDNIGWRLKEWTTDCLSLLHLQGSIQAEYMLNGPQSRWTSQLAIGSLGVTSSTLPFNGDGSG